MNRTAILLEFVKIEHDEARRYENQRERLFGFSFVATGAILTAIYADSSTTNLDIILAGAATFFNAFVSVTSLKFYLAFKRRYERYRALRSEIDKELEKPNLNEIIQTADETINRKNRYFLIERLKLHTVWSSLSWIMTCISAIVLVFLLLAARLH